MATTTEAAEHITSSVIPRRERLELRQLKYFVCIVEVGSLSRASQSLGVAQPALSQQVIRLENELGVKLLARSVRGVTPTEAGSAVYRHAQQILKQVDAIRLVAQRADSGPAGKVAIGLPWTLSSLLGLALLEEVGRSARSVRLEIVEGPSYLLADLLVKGKLDLALLFDNTTESGLVMKPVVAEPLFFVGCRHTLTGRSDIIPANAAEFPLLLLSRPNSIRQILDGLWAEANVKPFVVAEVNAPALLIDAVKVGLGYSVLPSCGIESTLTGGTLDAILLEGGRHTRTVFLSTSRLVPQSSAAEHVSSVVETLMHAAVREGRWTARTLSA